MRTIEYGATATPRTITTRGTAGTARATAVPGLDLVRVNDCLWRVVRPAGELVGYVELFSAPGGTRYRAKRFLPVQRRVLIDGEFWAMDDAVECFRTH